MNRQNVKVFLAVVEYGSISAAARALHFTQSTVSGHLAQLEKQIGTQLIFRGRGLRTIELTPVGKEFFPMAQRWMEIELQVDQLIRQQERRSLRLAASVGSHDGIIANIVQKMMQSDPKTEIRLSAVERKETVDAAERREFDVLLTYVTFPNLPDVFEVPLFRERRVILCPANTIYPDRCISTEELDMAFCVRYTGYISNVIDLWYQNNFPEDVPPYIVTSTHRGLSQYLNKPQCWSLAPINMAVVYAAQFPEKYTYREVSPEPPYRGCRLYVSKSYPHKRVIQTLLNCFDEYIEENQCLERWLHLDDKQ